MLSARAFQQRRDLIKRSLRQILDDLAAEGSVGAFGQVLAQLAHEARRCHDDHFFGLSGLKRPIEMLTDPAGERVLACFVGIMARLYCMT